MKKFIAFILLVLGLGCLAGAMCVSQQEIQFQTTSVKDPELLSQVRFSEYVSLPVLEGISIEENQFAGNIDKEEKEKEGIRMKRNEKVLICSMPILYFCV